MKKVLIWIAIGLGGLVLIGVIAGMVIHEKRPNGQEGPEADALARQMLAAVNQDAWDSTRFVQWTFPGGHHYIWDRNTHWVEVRWGQHRVLLHTPTRHGKAWVGDQLTTGEEAAQLLDRAWAFFANDSFWLLAFNKVFDSGTRREIVELDNGDQGLLVTYGSGGVTPGDSYLWLLDEKGRPEAWKIWVQIIPIGGLTFSWENWATLATGAQVALDHRNPLFNVGLSAVKGVPKLSDLELSYDPFAEATR